jgi:hypothetical protein
MSITIDDKAAIIFDIYDELTHTYTKEIDGYKTLIKAVTEMIDQKEKDLQNLKDKVIDLMKQSFSASPEADVPTEETEEAVVEMVVEAQPSETPAPEPIEERKPETPKIKKTAQKGSKTASRSKKPAAVKAGKKESKSKPSLAKKTEKPAGPENPVMCLHHPNTQASDIGKQLCSSCKWKIRANGLMGHDKNPEVVAFLKGEIKVAPLVGQPMCPIHPNTPAYNKKTGLCARCQSRAREIGISDRPLTDEELVLLQNPSL